MNVPNRPNCSTFTEESVVRAVNGTLEWWQLLAAVFGQLSLAVASPPLAVRSHRIRG